MEWMKQLRGNQKKIFKNNPTISLRLIDWHECDEREVEEIEYKTRGGELRTKKDHIRLCNSYVRYYSYRNINNCARNWIST